MGQEANERILELFFEFPDNSFTVRETAKETRIPKSTVQKYLTKLKQRKLIDKENKAVKSLLFKVRKTNFYIEKIVGSGLIEKLLELNPSVIILFGSFRKGESSKGSDIDIFIETHSLVKVDLTKYEKKLKHKIDLHIYSSIRKVSENLQINIINGIKLYGFLDIND